MSVHDSQGNNYRGCVYNVEAQGYQVQCQPQEHLQKPLEHSIRVDDNHPRYDNNLKGQGHEVHHQSQANFQNPFHCPIDVDDNHLRYGDNVASQGNKVHHPSQTLFQDPLDHPIDEEADLVYTSSYVKSSNLEALEVTKSIPSPGNLNTSTPSIFLEDASTIRSPTQEDTSYTSPSISIEWGLLEDLNDLEFNVEHLVDS